MAHNLATWQSYKGHVTTFPTKMKLSLLITSILATQDYFKLEHQVPDTDLVIKENEICNKNECYPKYFKPTTEFQPIKPGQLIQKGLHIRIDYQTQRKEAKLLQVEDDKTDQAIILKPNTPAIVANNDEQDSKININVKNDGEYKRPLNKQEQDTLENIFREMEQGSTELILERLEMLTERAYDIDVGYSFTLGNSGSGMVEYLKNPDLKIREKTALLLGACVGNNPGSIENLLKMDGFLKLMLKSLGSSDALDRHLVHIISAMIRDNEMAFEEFLGLEPIEILLKLENKRTVGKVKNLFRDVWTKLDIKSINQIQKDSRFANIDQ